MIKIMCGGQQVSTTKEKVLSFLRPEGDAFIKHPDETPIQGKAFDVLLSVLKMHPEAEHKIGPGVRAFVLNRWADGPPYFATRHFEIIRIDGTRMDFSPRTALSSRRDRVNRVFRNLIRPQIRETKGGRHGVIHHDLSGSKFSDLVTLFLSGQGFTHDTVPLKKEKAYGEPDALQDPRLEGLFKQLHGQADLVYVKSAEEHRKLHRAVAGLV